MKAALLLIVLALFVQLSFAQENSNSDIQVPATPGMSIIGIQNAEISKPGNYTGLFTSLVSPIVSNNGTIPTDLSLEFAPYYLQSRDITYNELGRTHVYRDLKISIASTMVVTSDTSTFSRMGIGFKTNLLTGNLTLEAAEKKEITLALANDINTVIEKINKGIYGKIDTADISLFVEHINDQNNDLKRKVEKLILENKENETTLIDKLEELKTQIEGLIVVDNSRWNYSLRTGSFLEFTGAFALDFPGNKFNNSEINRWGVWLSYTYRPKNNLGIFDLDAILRLSNYSFDPKVNFEDGSFFGDFGGGLNLRVPKTKFTVSGEWICKFGFTDLKASEGNNEYTFKSVSENKWNLSIGYQITKNTIWTMSLSELDGNSDYIKNKTMEFLMGISASLVPLKD